MAALLCGAAGALSGHQAAGARDSGADRTESARRVAAPAAVLIEDQGFESAVFPPPGWNRVDEEARQLGVPDRYVFSRETCDVDPVSGGSAAAWAVGDGSDGALLPCGGPYDDVIDSHLIYGPIDTSGFPGGLQANLRFKVDQPNPNALLVCATRDDPVQPFICYTTGVVQSDWVTFSAPLTFPESGGLSEAFVWISYRDRDPTGSHSGVFVDNVVIEGFAAPPTPTDLPTVTPTPSVTETHVPVPASPTPSSTPTATFTVPATTTGTSMPSPTRRPTETPSRTPITTATAGPSHTPSRTVTPAPTTPVPTASTVEPSRTGTSMPGTATASATAGPTHTPGGPSATPTDIEPTPTVGTATRAPSPSASPLPDYTIHMPSVMKGM